MLEKAAGPKLEFDSYAAAVSVSNAVWKAPLQALNREPEAPPGQVREEVDDTLLIFRFVHDGCAPRKSARV